MTKDDIMRWALESGGLPDPMVFYAGYERFAALVAAAEREIIAQSMDKQADLAPDEIDRQWAQEMAAAIRARTTT